MLFAMSDADKTALLEGKLDDIPGQKKQESRKSREATAATDSSRRSASPSKKPRVKLTDEEKEEAREEKEKAKEEKANVLPNKLSAMRRSRNRKRRKRE